MATLFVKIKNQKAFLIIDHKTEIEIINPWLFTNHYSRGLGTFKENELYLWPGTFKEEDYKARIINPK